MSKKRKSLATSLEEVDRTVYSTFCSGANSLSQLYSQAMNQQKLSFQAGERHGLEKLYQWILRQQEEGSRVAPVDIVAYLQTDLDCYGEEVVPLQNQHLQATVHIPNTASSGSSGAPPSSVHGFQSEHMTSSGPRTTFSQMLCRAQFVEAFKTITLLREITTQMAFRMKTDPMGPTRIDIRIGIQIIRSTPVIPQWTCMRIVQVTILLTDNSETD